MTLLLALDIHDRADEMLAAAAKWATALGAKLDVAYVDEYRYNLYLVQDPAVRTVLDEQWAQIKDDNEERLRSLVSTLPEAVRGTAVYLSGRAAAEIVEAGKERDGILIFTHGRHGLAHFFLGSVAERVVRDSTGPVIVLRLPASAKG